MIRQSFAIAVTVCFPAAHVSTRDIRHRLDVQSVCGYFARPISGVEFDLDRMNTLLWTPSSHADDPSLGAC